MIDIRAGRITDILPDNLSSQLEVQAFAYALHRQMVKLCDAADRTRIYAAIEQAPEEILDYLALELRTPCYEMTFPLATKRRLIAYTLPYYMKMGTPGMVNAVICAIFGNGHISEYWEAGLEPHHFTVHITGAEETTHPTANLREVLEQVKRKSQWLDAVELEFATMERVGRIGGVMGTVTTTPVAEQPDNFNLLDKLAAGGTVATITTTPVQNVPDAMDFEDRVNIGGGAGSVLTTPLAEL